jgi:hypothetical protein
MKQDWKIIDKRFYLPKNQPEKIMVPEFGFFMVEGRGNPNDDHFAEYIGVLYSLSYAVKMSPKQGCAPENYHEYAVYPLEGVWDIDDEAKSRNTGQLDKNSLVFKLMMRQPDFVTPGFAAEIIERTKRKKPHPLLAGVTFVRLEEGLCVQMMHHGSYDSEPGDFRKMEEFARHESLARMSLTHREIYLSDARRVAPDKLKTVLRFQAASAAVLI